MSNQDFVPVLADLQLLADILEKQDVLQQLGDCEDYPDGKGNCNLCTALQRLHSLMYLMENGKARIVAEEWE